QEPSPRLGQCSGMTPEQRQDYDANLMRRSSVVRILSSAVGLGVIAVGYGFQDRILARLPHTTAFVVVFAWPVFALCVWMDMIARRWRREEEEERRSHELPRHFASSPRTRRRHRKHR